MFRKAVVLIAEHDTDGALGFVVNRPTPAEIDQFEGPLADLPLTDRRIYSGGPVQPDGVAVLAEYAPEHAAERSIVGSLALAPLDDLTGATMLRAKVVAGYAGWGSGQL